MPTDYGGLSPGSWIGPYEIHSLLGAGGMGQVYRARDPRLGRDVAIKLLPEALGEDSERAARFEREARTLAALNHPHIGAIYGVEHLPGQRALVLELVEGETLAERITGRLSVADSLSIARQIADALEAAHEKGIIHRDLKPANVMIQSRRGLQVKVLDFGLAKFDESQAPDADISHSPTITFEGTKRGVILGTAAYMSPEQARGKPLDKRTDVWSFGCVLFEMLSGRRTFAGETVSDTIAAILGREPDLTTLPKDTPPGVRRLLERCLEKDVTRRLRDMGDVRVNLEHEIAGLAGTGSAPGAAGAGRRRSSRTALWLGIAAALVLGLATLVFWTYNRTIYSPAAVEPAVQLTDFYDSALAPALSPDGRMLTFIRGGNFGGSAARGEVHVKVLPGGEPIQLTHDGGQKEQPVFSPDGSRIVYSLVTNGFKWDSWQVSVLGGSPKPFLPNASGLTWLDEHQLLYSEITGGVHMKIVTASESRTEHRDVYVPPWAGSMAHRSARSPDGKSVLAVEMDGAGWLPCRLIPFDGSSAGHPVGPLDAQCTTASWSRDGAWMYFSSNAGGALHLWRQRYPDGKPEQITSGPAEQEGTTLTPDGEHLITSQGLQYAVIWTHDASGDRQLTSERFAMLPTMMPSGDRVLYLVRSGPQLTYVSGELWSQNLSTGQKEELFPGVLMAGYSLSRDGSNVIFASAGRDASHDGVWIANLDRRTPPRQLTRGGEFRALAGTPGEIVYMSQGDVRHLYRMKEDGSDARMICPDAVVYLIGVSPDGRWAVASLPQAPNSDGSKVMFFPIDGGTPYLACDDCVLGFGPNRQAAPMFSWSADGKTMIVSLKFYGMHTQRSIALPYDAAQPLERLWPRGLKTETDVGANPGARVIQEGEVFPGAADPGAFLFWRQTTQANLWKIPIPR